MDSLSTTTEYYAHCALCGDRSTETTWKEKAIQYAKNQGFVEFKNHDGLDHWLCAKCLQAIFSIKDSDAIVCKADDGRAVIFADKIYTTNVPTDENTVTVTVTHSAIDLGEIAVSPWNHDEE